MSLLSRISNLLKSNLNAAIDAVSDPAKEIDLLVAEMEEESKKSRITLRDALAREKLAQKKVDEALRNVQRWQEHAERAVTAGDDDLAREALRRRDDAERALEESERALAEHAQGVAKLTEQIRRNDSKLAEIKSRKETLKARAKQTKQVMKPEGDAFSRFDALVGDLEFKEQQAEAMAEIASDPVLNPAAARERDRDAEAALEARFNRLLPPTTGDARATTRALPPGPDANKKSGRGDDMDARLAALKARLDKKDPDTVT